MPTDTFFNLPSGKRQRIFQAGLQEFAEYPFDSASVARIVTRAEIPRGSFYQYFDDLMDLYRYLLEQAGVHKMRYLQDCLERESPRDILRSLYAAGMRFAVENPEFARMGSHFMRAAPEFKEEIFGEYRDLSLQFIQSILEKGQQGGEFDASLDVSMAAFVLHSSSQALVDQLVQQSAEDNIFSQPSDYLTLADRMLKVMECGFLSPAARKRRGIEGDQ